MLQDPRKRHDRFYRRARAENYPARSVYKLQELDRRFRLFQRGQHVLDLGCNPGSWLLYAAKRVGSRGSVLGVDRCQLEATLPPHVRTLVADVLTLQRQQLLRAEEDLFDVVLSDMAPDTSGIAFSDQARCIELFDAALRLATQSAAKGSSFVAKIFMGDGFDDALSRVKQCYAITKTVKPAATRKQSKELYVVGRGLRATTPLSSHQQPQK